MFIFCFIFYGRRYLGGSRCFFTIVSYLCTKFRALKYKFSDFLNLKTATLGAIFMGGLVYYVNREFGFSLAIVAALKQAFYTFFFGGACVRVSEIISVKTEHKWLGIILGGIVASFITIAAVYAIHVLKGTPLPYESTLPTVICAPSGFFVLAWMYRKKMDKLKEEQEFSSV